MEQLVDEVSLVGSQIDLIVGQKKVRPGEIEVKQSSNKSSVLFWILQNLSLNSA